MTTLNTIIEEEKEEFDGRMTSLDRYGGFYHGHQSGVELYNFDNIKSHLTTAMQRAYKAGREERDTYWKERVGEIRLLIAKYAKAEDMDVAGLVNEINTLCK